MIDRIVSHYRILQPIGSGGGGVVYEAEDIRLGRRVALKFVSGGTDRDGRSTARFLREARAVSALSHPHICTLLDVGEEDGVPFLVMERLEGRTLRSALADGPLPPRQVLEYGAQIAEALEAAHARGIVHRDIKPGNVFITQRGDVKLLDFGLARFSTAAAAAGAGEPATEITETAGPDPLTAEREAVGTVAFMSPEQARGEAVDHRTDLFSLGAVLYQMATGRLPFPGETSAVVFEALLGKDPPPVRSLNPAVPPDLESIVAKALEKDPLLRYQTAADLRVDLRRALRRVQTDSGRADTTATAATDHGGTRLSWRRIAAVAVAGLAIAVAAYFVAARVREEPNPRFTQLTFRRGVLMSARFAPDGHTVVYSASWDGGPAEIFQRRIETPSSVSLGLPPATLLAVSSRAELAVLLAPPGERGVLWLGTLARVPLSGGPVRPLLEDVFDADWSPDGRDLAIVRWVNGQFQLEYPQGTVLLRPSPASHVRVSPDGRQVALLDTSGIVIVERDGRWRTIPIPPLHQRLSWWPDGRSIVVDAGDSDLRRTLRRVRLDGRVEELAAMPGTLVVHDVGRDGRVLLHHGFERWSVRARAPGEAEEHDASAFANSAGQGLSDDGSRLLLWDGGDGPPGSLLLQPTRGGAAVRLAEGRALGLSGDARWVITESSVDGTSRVSLVPTGAGEPVTVPVGRLRELGFAWYIDRENIGLHGAEPGRPRRTFLVHVRTGEVRPFTPEGRLVLPGVLPDGDWLATDANGSIAIHAPDGTERRVLPWRLPADPFVEPVRVSGDGRFLFVRQGSVPARVTRLELATGRREPWRELSPAEPAGVAHIWSILITPDGDGYAYTHGFYLQDLFLVDGIR